MIKYRRLRWAGHVARIEEDLCSEILRPEKIKSRRLRWAGHVARMEEDLCSEILRPEKIKSRRLTWEGHVARMEEGRSAFIILTGKPTGNRSLGRPRSRWEENIRMDREQIGI